MSVAHMTECARQGPHDCLPPCHILTRLLLLPHPPSHGPPHMVLPHMAPPHMQAPPSPPPPPHAELLPMSHVQANVVAWVAGGYNQTDVTSFLHAYEQAAGDANAVLEPRMPHASEVRSGHVVANITFFRG